MGCQSSKNPKQENPEPENPEPENPEPENPDSKKPETEKIQTVDTENAFGFSREAESRQGAERAFARPQPLDTSYTSPLTVSYHLTAHGIVPTFQSLSPAPMIPWEGVVRDSGELICSGSVPTSFFRSSSNTQTWALGDAQARRSLGLEN